jgi:hypothetical protein
MIEGTSQKITINSDPVGAKCDVVNNGDVIATVEQTPGTITIPKSKNDIYVECSKDGYTKTRKKNLADIAITSFGNMAMLQLSFIGNAMDNASGAGHKYDSKVFVAMEKDTKNANTAQASPPLPAQQMAAVPPAAVPPSGSPSTGQAVSPQAQKLASQLVQEIQVAQQESDGNGTIVMPEHTQQLAKELVEEVHVQPVSAETEDPPYVMLPAHTLSAPVQPVQEIALSTIPTRN